MRNNLNRVWCIFLFIAGLINNCIKVYIPSQAWSLVGVEGPISKSQDASFEERNWHCIGFLFIAFFLCTKYLHRGSTSQNNSHLRKSNSYSSKILSSLNWQRPSENFYIESKEDTLENQDVFFWSKVNKTTVLYS